MRAPTLLRSVICAVVVLTGCRAAPAPAPSYAAPTDPAGQRAAAVLRQCAGEPVAEGMRCREQALLEVLRADGVRSAMTVLERMGEMDDGVRRDGHVYAHAVGLAAYTTPEEVGTVFGRCTPSYQSGCYHGVIQSYFADLAADAGPGGVTAEAINALCAAQRADAGRWQLFQCAHGMGHGLMLVQNHHLPRALAGCDLLTDPWERDACYGGAFMENVVQATAPHHDVGRPQAHGDEHAHHAGHSAQPEFRALDLADPLYPCTVLEERYLTTCYQMQTSAVLFFHPGDLTAVVRACQAAPERYRSTCYQSMGRDVSALTLQRHDEAQRMCALADPRHRPDCHVGYVKNVVDVTARPDDGFAFCRVVADGEEKRRCYEAVGEEIWVLEGGVEQRATLCAGAEPAYLDTCRRGAGLARQAG